MNSIDRNELAALLDSDAEVVLLEALPEKYYREGHLPRAVPMPHDRVDELAAIRAPDRDADVVVYCASDTCQNSAIAADRLRELGYSRVRVYAGGKADWVAAGLAVETPAAADAG